MRLDQRSNPKKAVDRNHEQDEDQQQNDCRRSSLGHSGWKSLQLGLNRTEVLRPRVSATSVGLTTSLVLPFRLSDNFAPPSPAGAGGRRCRSSVVDQHSAPIYP